MYYFILDLVYYSIKTKLEAKPRMFEEAEGLGRRPMKVTPEIEGIVNAALEGTALEHEQIVRLCDVDEFSLDAYYINWAADRITRRASEGIAEVHAQIGIDANPCSKDCTFCSFAVSNTARTGAMEMPIETIIDYARTYVEEGTNCLTIMITADYDFGKYVDYLAQVREAVGPEMPITANMGDFDLPMAERLKQAGAGSVYHAVRMGEGRVNRIPIDTRFETIECAHAAGLKVMRCLEMIDPRWSNDEVAANMLRLISCKPEMISAWGMIAVPGTRSYVEEHYTYPKYHMYSSVMRLACDRDTRFGHGNLEWAEVGTNPRDDSNATERDGLGESVRKVREDFEHQGWKTFRGPSPWW